MDVKLSRFVALKFLPDDVAKTGNGLFFSPYYHPVQSHLTFATLVPGSGGCAGDCYWSPSDAHPSQASCVDEPRGLTFVRDSDALTRTP